MYFEDVETLSNAPVLARFGYAVSDPTRARVVSDPTRARVLLTLADAPKYPSDLAESLGVSRQSMSNHLTCLRGCGLIVAVPD
jgi:DNA-binding transcriptional ArsR family regulator